MPERYVYIEIVFNAKKYCRILITNDGGSRSQPGGILGNASRLAELGITVMSDNCAVEKVEEKIRSRDKRAQKIADKFGDFLPEWFNQD